MKRLLLGVVKVYQFLLSPVMGGRCRFEPTCSEYAIEAIEKKGSVKGSIMTIKRLLRCHPFTKNGYDPVR